MARLAQLWVGPWKMVLKTHKGFCGDAETIIAIKDCMRENLPNFHVGVSSMLPSYFHDPGFAALHRQYKTLRTSNAQRLANPCFSASTLLQTLPKRMQLMSAILSLGSYD